MPCSRQKKDGGQSKVDCLPSFFRFFLRCGELAGLFQRFAVHLLFADVVLDMLCVQGVFDAM